MLLMCLLTLRAGDPPSQPLMLPMEHLLKRLDQTQEWMLVPLADYRALIAAATVKEEDKPGLLGARIATAHVSGTLDDDRILSLTGTLVIDAHGTGPQRCRLFALRPPRLGAITCNGQPAVIVSGSATAEKTAKDKVAAPTLDLLLPGPGRHQVTLSWGIDLAGDDQRRHGV